MTWDNKSFGECAELIKDIVQPSDAVGSLYIGLEHISQGQLSLLGFGKSEDVISAKSRFRKGDILFGKLRTYFRKVIIAPFDGVCSTDIWVVRAKPDIDQKFLFYWMASEEFVETSSRASEGTKMPRAQWEFVERIQQKVPNKTEQHAIAESLGALDDKIEVNRRMNATFESMARAVFRQWFVENEDVGNWEVGRLGDVITNFDSKRVPVANRERAQKQGKYPYYGAASVMDYVDDYLFDGIYVLMGEDGSVVDDDDHPVLQYVLGKFWVNNHAHVLRGTNGICNEHLYLFLKEVNILSYVTGAVQPKINQANMNSIPFVLPPMELRKKFEEFVSPLFAQIRANDEKSRTLGSLRDSLLPKLMRGEVRVREVEKRI